MDKSFKRPTRLKTIDSDIDYIMCIDENGSEALLNNGMEKINNNESIDLDSKYLTITGVIFTRENYSSACFEIDQLKKKYWKDGLFEKSGEKIAVCLHSRDIRRKNIPFDNYSINRDIFLNELTQILDGIDCKIISSSIDVEKYIRSEKYSFNIYHTAIQFLIERYIYATKNNKKGILILESRNQNQDKKILNQINILFEYGTTKIPSFEFNQKIVGVYFNTKRNSNKIHTYAGLEIADLFSYPIYKYIKLGKKDDAFKVVEKKLDKNIEKSIKIFP